MIWSDGKSKISPHENLTIIVFQLGDKSQSGHKNQKQRRAAAKRLKRKEQKPPCPVPGCDVPNHYPKRNAFDCHVPNLFNEDLDVGVMYRTIIRNVTPLTVMFLIFSVKTWTLKTLHLGDWQPWLVGCFWA